jgi:hypothetical protein
MQHWGREKPAAHGTVARSDTELRQWPVQLHLVPPIAPYFKNAHVALVADCVPFAYPNFHQDFLKDKTIAIACPKLDNIAPYKDKIRQIIEYGNIQSLKVIHMEVPCCFGLLGIAEQAIAESGRDIPIEAITIGIRGERLSKLSEKTQAPGKARI